MDMSAHNDDLRDLRFVMDESAIPYEKGENPFVRTQEDDDFERYIIEKYHIVTDKQK
ncbi:hypothetical protein IKQ26_07375 [bacterium]|nr:hypothetical protein [bacterium]